VRLKSIIYLLAILPFIASAQESTVKEVKDPWKRLDVNLGGYVSKVNSTVKVGNEEHGIGLNIDLEKALDLENTSNIFRAEIGWSMGKKKRSLLQLNYFSINRFSQKTIEVDLEYRDLTYYKGTTIRTHSEMNFYSLSYGYSFFKNENFNLGASFGVYAVPMSVQISASGYGDESTTVIAPLPVFGIYSKFAFSEKFILIQSISIFYIEYENYEGSFTDLNIRLEYNAWKHLGFGLGINALNFEGSATEEVSENVSFKGTFGYNIKGALGYIKLYF